MLEQNGIRCSLTLANPHFIFYDSRNAEAITSTGQVAIKFIAKKFNEYFNALLKTDDQDFVVAVDTDSNYLRFGPVVRKFFPKKTDAEIVELLDKIAKEKIQPFIDKSYLELAGYLNCFSMEWKMKREAIASRAVFVQKKRYFMAILDDEGVRMKEHKIKVTGLEAVRSSTPEICRDGIKKVMKSILLTDEKNTQKLISEFKKKFYDSHILDIAFPRSVNSIEKWTDNITGEPKKGCPIAVRGAIVYNTEIRKKDKTAELIKSGDKVKFFYLNEPNTFKSHVMALPNYLPESLGLKESDVDKNSQFDKTFMMPIRTIMTLIGWTPERVVSLLDFC